MGKFSTYIAKVNVPCRKCHTFVKAGINEKIAACPSCRVKWN